MLISSCKCNVILSNPALPFLNQRTQYRHLSCELQKNCSNFGRLFCVHPRPQNSSKEAQKKSQGTSTLQCKITFLDSLRQKYLFVNFSTVPQCCWTVLNWQALFPFCSALFFVQYNMFSSFSPNWCGLMASTESSRQTAQFKQEYSQREVKWTGRGVFF